MGKYHVNLVARIRVGRGGRGELPCESSGQDSGGDRIRVEGGIRGETEGAIGRKNKSQERLEE